MADTICERPLPSFTLILYRDVAKKMETLKSLMLNNGDENSSIFFLKVIFKADLLLLSKGYAGRKEDVLKTLPEAQRTQGIASFT